MTARIRSLVALVIAGLFGFFGRSYAFMSDRFVSYYTAPVKDFGGKFSLVLSGSEELTNYRAVLLGKSSAQTNDFVGTTAVSFYLQNAKTGEYKVFVTDENGAPYYQWVMNVEKVPFSTNLIVEKNAEE